MIHRYLPGTVSLWLLGTSALLSSTASPGPCHDDIPGEEQETYSCMHQFGQASLLLVRQELPGEPPGQESCARQRDGHRGAASNGQ